MTNKSLLSLALACSMFAGAASASTAPSFDYVSAGFVTEKDDEIGDRANGVAGEFSKSFYDTQWFFFSFLDILPLLLCKSCTFSIPTIS